MQTFIRPTTTQRVRDFLVAEGVAAQPWSSLDDTYAALYGLLRARSDDNSFWKPLSALLRDVVADAADGPRRLPAPQAELLHSWDVEELVRDLRRALPGRCAPACDYRGFSRTLAAPVLGGFLVLGLTAAGCDTPPGESGDTPAWAEGCSLDASGEIYDAIDAAEDIVVADKAALCGCMAAMQSSWQQNLSEAFASCSPENIATLLEEYVGQCESNGGTLAEDPSGLAQGLCWGAAYKGVSFPTTER
jgi:hypothetical protein